jgi:hypothetical protein
MKDKLKNLSWLWVIAFSIAFISLVIKGSTYNVNSSQTSTELVSYENDFYVVDASVCNYNSAFSTVWKSTDETEGLVIQDENLYWKVVGTNNTYNFEIQINKIHSDYSEVSIKIGEDTYRGKMYDIGE